MSGDTILETIGDTNFDHSYSVVGYASAAEGIAYTDAIHCSGAKNGRVVVRKIIGGSEDCVDCNNGCENLRFLVVEYEANGKFVATVKGGSVDIYHAGVITKHGTEVDFDFGNWSDQSWKRTRSPVLCIKTLDGSPVTYRVLNSDDPILINRDFQEYKCIFRLWRWAIPFFLCGYATLKQLNKWKQAAENAFKKSPAPTA